MIRQTTQDFLSAIEPGDTTVEAEAPDETLGEISPLQMVYYPSEVLKQPCQPVGEVTEEIKQLARDMLLTMMLEGGVGLAAPQIGKLLRVFVVDVRWPENLDKSDPHIFINPELVVPYDESKALGFEGCLSFPGGRAKMSRYSTIKVKHLDGEGCPTETEANGFFARVIQHEMDHLDGKTIQGAISAIDMMKVRKTLQTKARKHKRETKATPRQHKKNVRKRSR